MRPIYHPHRDEITVQGILYALSDPVRVQILSQLMGADCSQNCTTFVNVCATPLPKSTLSQHFKILREAGLVRSERKGVELQNRSRCEDLQKFKPMLREILAAYQAECQAELQKGRIQKAELSNVGGDQVAGAAKKSSMAQSVAAGGSRHPHAQHSE
jgi:DNA-binding transcriptional ArsR family regulator